MHLLTLIHHIDNLVRIKELPALYQGCQVGGGIQGRSVGLQNHAGRNLLGIGVFLDVYHQRALALVSEALFLQLLHHIRDVGLGIGLALPQVKFYIQVRVIALQVGHRHI